VRTVNTEHVSVAHTSPCLKMKLGYEATADKSNSKFVRQQTTLPNSSLNTSAQSLRPLRLGGKWFARTAQCRGAGDAKTPKRRSVLPKATRSTNLHETTPSQVWWDLGFVMICVTSWIVPFCGRGNDPQNYTKQHDRARCT